MFNFYVVLAGNDMVAHAGKATMLRLKFKGPSLPTKSTKNEAASKNMGFNGETV